MVPASFSPPPSAHRVTILFAAVALCIPLLLLWLNARRVYPFLADDALISLRYSDRLLHGQGLTWNDGERVEGYSNLLWVLLCALLGGSGLDLVTAARLLGAICSALTIAAIFRCYWRDAATRGARLAPALTGAAAMAVSSSFAVWTSGGLEQPLLAALLAWSITLIFPLLTEEKLSPRQALAPAILLGLAAWTRPDGFLFAAAIGTGVVVALGFRRAAFRLAVVLVAVPLVFVAVQLLARRIYYHDWVPNTAHVKLDLNETR
jgi:arabinofuranosyltransferase